MSNEIVWTAYGGPLPDVWLDAVLYDPEDLILCPTCVGEDESCEDCDGAGYVVRHVTALVGQRVR